MEDQIKPVKKVNRLIVILWAVLFSGLTSCIPEPLELEDVPIAEPEIVVASQVIENNTLLIWLTRTIGALENVEALEPAELVERVAVNDAIVTIEGPAGTDTLEFLQSGVYTGIFTFQEGQQYHLTVESRSLGIVSASSTVQPPVAFDELEGVLRLIDGQVHDGNDTLDIFYAIKDPVVQKKYMINVQKVDTQRINKPDLLAERMINPKIYTKLSDYTDMKNSIHRGKLTVLNGAIIYQKDIMVTLSNVSDAYYRFMDRRVENRIDFVSFVSEPGNFPTNINGGRGFFEIYLPDIRLITPSRQ